MVQATAFLRAAATALLIGHIGIGLVGAVSPEPTDYFPENTSVPAYISWYEERGIVNYEHSTFLSSYGADGDLGDGVAVHWEIDDDASTLRLAVAAPATGWVGFGLAESGGMPGSDVVLFDAETNSVTDAYVGDFYAAPQPDSTSQDWTLIHSQVTDGFIIFEAERALVTDDTQDRPIKYDGELAIPPHRVIAAWGDTPGVTYHGINRARSALRFWPIHGHVGREGEVFADAMAEEAEGYFDLRAEDYPIPQVDTEYASICWSYDDLLASGMPSDVPLHIIGFEPLIDSAKHVHHIVMFGAELKDELDGCDTMSLALTGSMSMAWSYAPGGVPTELPQEAGVALGDGGFTYFFMNLHYDNRWGDAGVTDSSGVRVYYTSSKRKYDMGVMQLGDPFVSLADEPIGSGLTRHDFDCPASCTASTFQEEVTVYKEILHMHEVGASMVNEHTRDGDVVRRSVVEYWDFEQAGLHEVQQDAFTMKPGDGVRTSCFFNSTIKESKEGSSDLILYGVGSKDEMCISYLHYYPKQSLPLGICGHAWFVPTCSSVHTSEAVEDLEYRLFGMEPEVADTPAAASPDDGNVVSPTQEKDEEEEVNEPAAAPSPGVRLLMPRILVSAGVVVCLAFLEL